MKYFRSVLTSLSILLFAACTNNESIIGTWIQPVPGQPGNQQGFTLKKDGQASSVNMATLCYDTWKRENSLLILSGKSIGNRLILSFSDTLNIERLTRDSLILKQGELVLLYTRESK